MSDSKPNLNVTDIYNILYEIDKDSLIKFLEGKTDELADETKAKLSKAEKISRELGWDEKGLYFAIEAVLENI